MKGYADFETAQIFNDKNEVVDAKVCLWGLNANDNFYWGIDLYSFFQTILKNYIRQVYFHVASYDVSFLRSFLVNEYGYKPCGIIGIDCIDGCPDKTPKSFKEMTNELGMVYKFEIYINQDTTISIECTWLKTMLSISSWGQILNLPKGEIDYRDLRIYQFKKDVPQEYLDYLKRDIDIMIQAHKFMINVYADNLTRASISMTDFVNHYGSNNFANDFGGFKWDYRKKKRVYHNVLSKDEWDFVRKSYTGGYVSWNKNIQNKDVFCEKGVALDVNSLFPAVMSNYEMPYGQCWNNEPLGNNVKLLGVWIRSAKKKDPKFPSLIKDSSGSTYTSIKYLDEITTKSYRVYWEEEFELIQSVYEIEYEIERVIYFKTKKVFDKWIQDKYHLKQYATTKPEREIHKGVLNSLYGKFAQHYLRESKILVKLDPKIKVRKNQVVYGKKDKKYIFENVVQETDELKYIPIASYITMKARMVLWNAILDNIDYWLYSDTDSCYFTSTDLKNIEYDDSKLGLWKPERLFNRFRVMRAKAYMIQQTHIPNKENFWLDNNNKNINTVNWTKNYKTIRKISGLPSTVQEQVGWEQFVPGYKLEKVKKTKQRSYSGVILIDIDFEFKDR